MLKIIKLIIIFLLFFLLIFVFSLFVGIKIDSFSFANFSISQLYIKFDKKLILEAKEIVFEMKESNVESSRDDIKKNIEKLLLLFKVFQKIDIKRLKIKGNEFTIALNDKHLYLNNKYINLAADLKFEGSTVALDIYSLYLKDINLTFIGKSKINLSKDILNFFGTYLYNHIEGELNIQFNAKTDILDFYINTTKDIKSINFFKKLFRLDSVAEAWMYDNIKGNIRLNYLYGKFNLDKKLPIIDSLKGQAVIRNATIMFDKDAKVINTKKLIIDYKNDTLFFDIKDPIYNKSKIYGSKVTIPHLTSLQKGEVIIDLKTKVMLNEDILEILKTFKINLPLIQKSGKLDSSLILRIPYLASKKIKIDGIFNATNAVLKLNNFEFLAKKAQIILKDNMVFIRNAYVKHKNMINAKLDLDINTKTLKAKGVAKINSFSILNGKSSIVNIKNLTTKLEIDFKDSTKINLKALKTQLDISTESVKVFIQDLGIIYPYSNLLKKVNVKKGDLKINILDENNITFNVHAKELDFPFEKNGKKIKTLQANGVIKNSKITINTNNSDIKIILKKNKSPLLKLTNMDLLLNYNDDKSNKIKKIPDIDLQLKNSTIIFDEENSYQTSWAYIYIKDSKINFEGKVLNLYLKILKKGEKVTALNLNGTYKNNIFIVKTSDNKLKLKYLVLKNKIQIDLEGYDVLYDTSIEEDDKSKIDYYINGVNSNIIINDKYVVKANKYNFVFKNHVTQIDLKYKNTRFIYFKDYLGKITVTATNMNDDFLNSLINNKLIKNGTVNLKANGKDDVISGHVTLKDTIILDLAILNNLLILINTSPALINPLLVIPSVVGMATSRGFKLNGYKVIKGNIDFTYDFKNKYLNMHKIFTKGNGVDFDGNTTIDFKTSKINAKLKLILFKNYSKIVNLIPVVNYILLGDKKRVDTQVEIYGTLDKPKYITKLAKDGISAPINIIKRIIASPIKLLGIDIKSKKSE